VNQFGGPSVLTYEDVPLPTISSAEVLIQIEAVGINPVETYIRTGNRNPPPPLPYTPGSDCAGVIHSVGDQVKKFKVGDRVYTSATISGAYAQYASASERTVHHLPDNTSFEQGAALTIPYATAYHALFHRAGAKPGESVLIHGASGGVGIACIQWAIPRGLTVIGTASSDQGKKLLESQHVHHVLDHSKEEHFQEVVQITNGGVDVIMEMLANVNLAKDLKIVCLGGRVVVIGSRGTIEIDPRDTMTKRSQVVGMSLFTATEPELKEIHHAIYAGLSNKSLDPIIAQTYPLREAARAHEDVIHHPGGSLGKLILLPKL